MQESPLVGRAKRLLLFSIAAAPSWGIRTLGLLMRAFLFHSTYRIYINDFCILQQLPAHQYFNNRFAHSCKRKGLWRNLRQEGGGIFPPVVTQRSRRRWGRDLPQIGRGRGAAGSSEEATPQSLPRPRSKELLLRRDFSAVQERNVRRPCKCVNLHTGCS